MDKTVLPLIFALTPPVVSKCAIKIKFLSSVILPYGRVILLSLDNSVIEFCGFSVILFATKLAKRIKLALCPYEHNAYESTFLAFIRLL